jgi:hypothetical protein
MSLQERNSYLQIYEPRGWGLTYNKVDSLKDQARAAIRWVIFRRNKSSLSYTESYIKTLPISSDLQKYLYKTPTKL